MADEQHRPLRILVTGAQGYLGNQIMQQGFLAGLDMIATGRHVPDRATRVDLMDRDSVADVIKAQNPDWVIHCAAKVPVGAQAYGDKNAANDSVRMVDHVIAAKPSRLIYISSMTVYGTDVVHARENDLGGAPASAYGQGKRDGEQLAERSKIPGFCARIPGLFGASREGGLVSNLIDALRCGDTSPRLPDTPLQWSAMQVTDAARSIVNLLASEPADMKPVNIGYGGAVSIRRMVEHLARRADVNVEYAIAHPDFIYDLNRFSRISGRNLPDFEDALDLLYDNHDAMKEGVLAVQERQDA